MTPGVEFDILWFDDDLIEIRVRASNGVFSGAADCYVARRGGLAELVDALRGFPETGTDVRSVGLGDFRDDTATGGARLDFRCSSGRGDAVIEVRLQGQDDHAGEARFLIPVEAAGMDRFVVALAGMEPEVGDRALVSMVRS